jgi:hypothetical protein
MHNYINEVFTVRRFEYTYTHLHPRNIHAHTLKCAHICAQICTQMHMHTHITFMRMHSSPDLYAGIHMYAHMCMRTCTDIYTHTHTCVHKHTQARTYDLTCMYSYIQTDVNTQTNIHTHKKRTNIPTQTCGHLHTKKQ